MYDNMDEFRVAQIVARNERDHFSDRLSQRWTMVKMPGTRGALVRDAISDALRSWIPYRRIHDLLKGRVSASTLVALATTIAAAQRHTGRRLLFSGIIAILGRMFGSARETNAGPGALLVHLASALIQRMRKHTPSRANGVDLDEDRDHVDIAKDMR